MWRENAAWVKKAGGGVWSRRANLLPGSRRPAMQCGLWRENAAWVKKAGDGVWSRRANLLPGSKDLAAECGLWRENAAWVKKAGGVVWLVARKRRVGQESRWCSVACGEKTPPGSRKPVAECGWWRENAAWVKKAGDAVWFVARKRRVGQRNCWCSVVCGAKTPRGSKDLAAECGLGGRICRVGQRTWRRSVV